MILDRLIKAMLQKLERATSAWQSEWTRTYVYVNDERVHDPVLAMELLGAFDRLSEEMNLFSREMDGIIRRARKRQRQTRAA